MLRGYRPLLSPVWTDPKDSEINIQWTRDFLDAMQPFLADAAYVNYLGEEGEERVRSAYGAAKYERLAGLKTSGASAIGSLWINPIHTSKDVPCR